LIIKPTNVTNLVRINSGGAAVATSLGNFAADATITGSITISSTADAKHGTTNDSLYQNNCRASTRGGSFSYAIPETNGQYLAKLHSAGTFHTTPGLHKSNIPGEVTT
jgi:hypothetical protein